MSAWAETAEVVATTENGLRVRRADGSEVNFIPSSSAASFDVGEARELIAAGYQPGAAFRPMLRAVEDAQLEGTIATPAEALALLRGRFPLP